MDVRLTYYGHACFSLSCNAVTLIADPFFTGNTWRKAAAEDISCHYIFVSHGHHDHYGDADSIGGRNDALLIASAEVAAKGAAAGLRTHAMHLGGKSDFPFGSLRLVPAFHGAGVPGGHAAGALITFFGKTVYFAGDTALYSDMKLLNRFGDIDCALLPIGDNFTMGPEDALLAADWVKANVTIPIHYGTWPVIEQDPQAFVEALTTQYGRRGLVVEPGGTLLLP
ncbi:MULTISPECIES: metal-dependent hydrolase [Megasphaera]|uniref:UPF0173 metal-dependent hydrolase HMPREF1250_1564 n=1 Tax=Megasphaera vaginalis (ex Srinivasan et al. 2021) TaxID=1111454 RepID=U7UAK7_9FIRM|nr:MULTISPECIES: metal-dependent hydrolase [Megasphaera]ERT56477.1 beta-lactamase family protein [Megasphaera vaginalis (ex Srinivasan et al. 2021)]